MKCKQAQQQLSMAADITPVLQSHLDTCPDCREFAADLAGILGKIDPDVTTPVLLREQTLDLCRTILAEQTNGHKATGRSRLRGLVESPRFVIATAVLSVLLLATSIVLQALTDPAPGTNMIVRITIAQIVLQNLVAALLMPALLMFRNRLGERRLSPAQSGE